MCRRTAARRNMRSCVSGKSGRPRLYGVCSLVSGAFMVQIRCCTFSGAARHNWLRSAMPLAGCCCCCRCRRYSSELHCGRLRDATQHSSFAKSSCYTQPSCHIRCARPALAVGVRTVVSRPLSTLAWGYTIMPRVSLFGCRGSRVLGREFRGETRVLWMTSSVQCPGDVSAAYLAQQSKEYRRDWSLCCRAALHNSRSSREPAWLASWSTPHSAAELGRGEQEEDNYEKTGRVSGL